MWPFQDDWLLDGFDDDDDDAVVVAANLADVGDVAAAIGGDGVVVGVDGYRCCYDGDIDKCYSDFHYYYLSGYYAAVANQASFDDGGVGVAFYR